jgi:uncharacterized protein YbbK (DUF523 family)
VKVIRELEAAGIEVIPVCPEVLGGLPVPRPPVKTRKGRVYETDAGTRTAIGRELTAEFQAGARKALEIAIEAGAKRAYFFMLSPSCAVNGIAGKIFAAAGIEVIPTF